MPRSPAPACRRPGCPERAAGRERLCATHRKQERRQHDKDRGSAASRGYDGEWRRVRDVHLRQHEQVCRFCRDEGRIVRATHVDHIIALADGGTHRHSNLRSLCASHHNARTAKDQAFGRDDGRARRRWWHR